MQAVAAAATLQDVPYATDTPIVARTCVVEQIYLCNGTDNPRTVLIHDGYARQLVPAMPIPPNSVTIFEVNRVRCQGGLSWQASGAGVTGYVLLQA